MSSSNSLHSEDIRPWSDEELDLIVDLIDEYKARAGNTSEHPPSSFFASLSEELKAKRFNRSQAACQKFYERSKKTRKVPATIGDHQQLETNEVGNGKASIQSQPAYHGDAFKSQDMRAAQLHVSTNNDNHKSQRVPQSRSYDDDEDSERDSLPEAPSTKGKWWTDEEQTKFYELAKVEGLDLLHADEPVPAKPIKRIAEGLKKAGFTRSTDACRSRWNLQKRLNMRDDLSDENQLDEGVEFNTACFASSTRPRLTNSTRHTSLNNQRSRDTVFDPAQKIALQRLFKINPYPTLVERTQLAEDVNLSVKQVQTWCTKNREKQTDKATPKPSSASEISQPHPSSHKTPTDDIAPLRRVDPAAGELDNEAQPARKRARNSKEVLGSKVAKPARKSSQISANVMTMPQHIPTPQQTSTLRSTCFNVSEMSRSPHSAIPLATIASDPVAIGNAEVSLESHYLQRIQILERLQKDLRKEKDEYIQKIQEYEEKLREVDSDLVRSETDKILYQDTINALRRK